MKKKLSLFLTIVICLNMFGCSRPPYKGKHQGLYTVALHSLLWINGLSYQTDLLCDPNIQILEQDSYGRVLFTYTEKKFADFSFSCLLVSQKEDGNYVYYYADYNFLLVKKEDSNSDECVAFSNDDIERLKVMNDWERELDLNKCERKLICDRKNDIPLSGKQLDMAIDGHNNCHGSQNFYYFTEDSYGRFICYGYVLDDYFAILFNPDLTYNPETCYFVPSDYYNYQEEFRAFKERNHWNQPYE